jgi:AraC-like DNA-binding protein
MQMYSPLQPPAFFEQSLNSNYRYREYMPSTDLLPFIACYWTVDYHACGADYVHRVIPDGCVDIIFDMNTASSSKGAFVAGLMTTFETMNLTEDYSMFGIRFYSHKIRCFISYPVSELKGHHVLLEDIWGREADFVVDEVKSALRIQDAIERLELRFRKMLLGNEYEFDSLLQPSMRFIYESKGMITFRELAEKLSYSERNVRRIFSKELGIGPKELLDIIRFQSLLRELNRRLPTDLTELALKYGYYDQPHFIHRFKRLLGLTPNQVFK